MTTTLERRERRVADRIFAELHLVSNNGVNALSGAVVAAISDTLGRLGSDNAVQGFLISAEGRLFSAGADVKEFQTFGAADFERYMTDILSMYVKMTETPRPIVSLVHADALGGGAALAFFSDLVIAADTARFGLPEIHRGLAGGGYLMPKLVGKHRAAEMVLLGRTFSAGEMKQWGLVNEVCPATELDRSARAICEELAGMSTDALTVAKRSLSGGLGASLGEAMKRHIEAQTAAFVAMRGHD